MRARPWSINRDDDAYPPGVLELDERAPEALHGRGDRNLVAGLDPGSAVTIVGSRRAGAYAREIATELGAGCAAAGLVVVSGMALGCDEAAHLGALAAGGRTIAVLAGGPDHIHPRSNAELYDRIVATGAVLSENPPGMVPAAWHFAARDRIMAALSAMTIVVAGAVPSGTQITADEATGLHREVGGVPGPLTSALSELPHQLIRDGATLVRDPQDVLDVLLGVGAVSIRGIGPELEPELARVLDAVTQGCATGDAVALEAGIDGADAAIALARLELMGYLQADAGGRLARTRLRAPGE
jgi:DNA processing protein